METLDRLNVADDEGLDRSQACGSGDRARVLLVPECVRELRLDLDRERLIKIVGQCRNGELRNWLLKITGKGKLTLV